MTFLVAAVVCLVLAQAAGIAGLKVRAELTFSLLIVILLLASAALGYLGVTKLVHSS
jgi:hypothetical protein